MKTIKIRALDYAEAAELDLDSDFYVTVHGYKEGGPLVPAKLRSPLSKQDRETLKEKATGPNLNSVPSAYIHNMYNTEYTVGLNRIYVEDPDGRPHPVVETVGTQVGLTIFAPGMEGPDVLERVHKALRNEFGIGVLQLRTQHHQPVSEEGLPAVLGVPEGQVPKMI